MSQYFLYLAYMVAGIILTVLFTVAYVLITPAREIQLIRQGNLACALSLGGAIIGFLYGVGFSDDTQLGYR